MHSSGRDFSRIYILTDDFLFNRANSKGIHKPHIRQAQVNLKE